MAIFRSLIIFHTGIFFLRVKIQNSLLYTTIMMVFRCSNLGLMFKVIGNFYGSFKKINCQSMLETLEVPITINLLTRNIEPKLENPKNSSKVAIFSLFTIFLYQ